MKGRYVPCLAAKNTCRTYRMYCKCGFIIWKGTKTRHRRINRMNDNSISNRRMSEFRQNAMYVPPLSVMIKILKMTCPQSTASNFNKKSASSSQIRFETHHICPIFSVCCGGVVRHDSAADFCRTNTCNLYICVGLIF